MQQWEYTTEAMGVDNLRARGMEGWELVAVQAGVVFYKRPYVAPPAAEPAPAPRPAVEPAPAPVA